jgi:50S ribosomal subunit-associated GTPase HflX
MINTLHPDAICISAKTGINLELLSEAILKRFKGREVIVKVSGSNAYGKIHSYLRAYATILDEQYEDSHYSIQARIGRNQLTELKRLKPENLEIDD